MPEFVIFLHPTAEGRGPLPLRLIEAHVAHLARLESEARYIVGGPFEEPAHGGIVVGRFESLAEAEDFGRSDPFVSHGLRRSEVRRFEWSRAENGHLGTQPRAPGTQPTLIDALALRATTRHFLPRSIDEKTLEAILEAALRAPSEFNLQPWRPIVCHSLEDRRRLRRCCLDQPQVETAAASIICAVDTEAFTANAPRAACEIIERGRAAPEEREALIRFIRSCYVDPRESAIRHAAIFGQQFLLAGLSRGLAGFWLAGLDEAMLRTEFAMPPSAVVGGVVGLGWSERRPQPMPRLDPSRLIGRGRWPEDPA